MKTSPIQFGAIHLYSIPEVTRPQYRNGNGLFCNGEGALLALRVKLPESSFPTRKLSEYLRCKINNNLAYVGGKSAADWITLPEWAALIHKMRNMNGLLWITGKQLDQFVSFIPEDKPLKGLTNFIKTNFLPGVQQAEMIALN